jgi:hypothetical protein
MDPLRMVRLVTASSPMEAKVLAARLGAEGIVWELRGSVDGPLALGPIEVLVDANELASARELLLIDDLESSFADGPEDAAHVTTGRDVLWVGLVLLLVVLFAMARMATRV